MEQINSQINSDSLFNTKLIEELANQIYRHFPNESDSSNINPQLSMGNVQGFNPPIDSSSVQSVDGIHQPLIKPDFLSENYLNLLQDKNIDPESLSNNDFSKNNFGETDLFQSQDYYFSKQTKENENEIKECLYFLNHEDHINKHYFYSTKNPDEKEYQKHESFDVNLIRKDFPILQQKIHGKDLIWFDNAATTQKPNSVIHSISDFYQTINSNIHRGAHDLASKATEAYENARIKVKNFIGASSEEEIIFVRGCTEGINLVAYTYGKKWLKKDDEILVSELEHHANIVPWQIISKETGAKIVKFPINDNGEIILEEYSRLLNSRTKIVAISQVSNALGTIVPVKQITDSAHRHNAIVLVDGAQSVAHQTINVQEIGCDFFCFSGHKIYGPTGIGVVYGKKEILELLPPWQGGGNMIKEVKFEETTYNDIPNKFEAGTPNVADAVGLGIALDYISNIGLANIEKYEHELTNYAISRLKEIPNLILIGTAREKVSVLSFIIDGFKPEEIGKLLDSEGIAVRVGHHCAQPALRRFGLDQTIRPSIAMYNTTFEIDKMIQIIKDFVK